MAFPTSVNNQITDAVTQTNTKVLGEAPAIALGNLYEATSQQQSFVTDQQAATTTGVSTPIDTASTSG